MHSITKLFARLALALIALAAFTAPAFAAVPSNDIFPNAKVVTLGFNETLDTTEATTDKGDKQVNQSCGAPATDASVWYALDGDGSGVIVDVSSSSYSAGVIIATGRPGKLTTLICGPSFVTFRTEPGTRYYILAFDDQEDGSGNGGMLDIQVLPAFVPAVDFSVNKYGTLDRSSGSATISGSYTCSAGASFSIFVDASQKHGRSTIIGFSDFAGECDGTAQHWVVVVAPESGKFTATNLQTSSFGVASTPDIGTAYRIEQKVKLHGKRK